MRLAIVFATLILPTVICGGTSSAEQADAVQRMLDSMRPSPPATVAVSARAGVEKNAETNEDRFNRLLAGGATRKVATTNKHSFEKMPGSRFQERNSAKLARLLFDPSITIQDRSVKAVTVAIKPALSIPAFSVERYCGKQAVFFLGAERAEDQKTSFARHCIADQQSSYDALKIMWADITPGEQARCLAMTGHTSNYESVRLCVSGWYSYEADRRRGQDRFHY